jgi:hypothetical protein
MKFDAGRGMGECPRNQRSRNRVRALFAELSEFPFRGKTSERRESTRFGNRFDGSRGVVWLMLLRF